MNAGTIYNSRNYNGVLNLPAAFRSGQIYNSRNYNGVLNNYGLLNPPVSTIVEIITEY